MNGGWTESSLETRVGVLAARLEGRAFVDAIGELAATLDDDERAILREILLRRAKEEAAHGYPFAPRLDEPRWRLFGPRSREPGRD